MSVPMYDLPETLLNSEAYRRATPMATEPPEDIDYVGLWYEARLKFGIDDQMLFGIYEPGADSPRWYRYSHRFYDGLGALALLMKTRGLHFPDGLPKGRDTHVPSLLELYRASRKPLEAPALDVRWQSLQPERTTEASHMPVTLLLSPEETDRIEAVAKARGVRSTFWLFWAADRAAREILFAPGAVMPWLYPVNQRGAVACQRDSMNHASAVTIHLADNSTPGELRQQVTSRLERLEHWRVWFMVNLGRWIGRRGIHWLYRLVATPPGRYAGSYTNLGAWDAPATDGVICASPCSHGYPVSVNTIVCNGRRALAVRLHPVVAGDGTLAGKVLTRWKAILLDTAA